MLGKHRLDPKEDAVLKIIYDTDGRPGPYEKRIYLITNSLVQPRLDITLKGEVLPAPAARIKVEPRKINVGSLRRGSQNRIDLKVTNEGNQSLEITKIYSATDRSIVTAKGELRKRIPPKESTELEITFQATTVGSFVEVLIIDSDARNALNGQYTVMVIGEAGP